MKKTQWIDLCTTIKRSKIPYIAIVILVTLGIALFGGISWVCSYINIALNQTCAESHLMHMTVTYPYGISDEQLDELRQIDGVDEVEGYNYVYRFFEQNGERHQAIIYQMTENVNTLKVTSGTLPKSENEIAVLKSWAEDNNVSVGDTITFMDDYGSDYRKLRIVESAAKWDPNSGEEPDTDTSDPGYLKTDTFKITAIVESPVYLMSMSAGYGSNAINGVQVEAVMYVSKATMDPDVFNGYISAAIYSESLAAMQEGDEYDAAYEALQKSVNEVIENWTTIPDEYNSVMNDLGKSLEDAKKRISDAETQIEEKQKELEDGEQAYAEGQNTLAAQWENYYTSKAQYEAGLASANSAAAQLEEGWYKYNCLASDIQAAKELIKNINTFIDIMSEEDDDSEEYDQRADKAFSDIGDSAEKLYELLDSQSALLSSMSGEFNSHVDFDKLGETCVQLINCETIEEANEKINEIGDWFVNTANEIVNTVDQMYLTLAASQAELDQAYIQLNNAAAQLSDGLNQLYEGQAKLEAAATQIAEGKEALQKAKEELEENKSKYDEAMKVYETMVKYSGSVYDVMPVTFTRDTNIALVSAYAVRDIVWKARYIMAAVFLAVAVFVGYTTLARMVADTKLQIGTKKALGFTRWETLRMYLLYAFSAVVLGLILGSFCAYGVEIFLRNTFTNIFEVKSVSNVVQIVPVIIPFLIEAVLLGLTVIFAALHQLNRKTIDLLNGNDESKKKRHAAKFMLFRKMPLLDRIIFKNLWQDKRRVVAMLIGIGGAAMLITSGLTCWLNMGQSVNLEYEKYFKFDTVIRYDPLDEKASSQVREVLEKYGVTYAEVCHTHVMSSVKGGTTRISDVFVPVSSEDLSKLIRFDIKGARDTDYTSGFWLSDFYSSKLGLAKNDSVNIQSLSGGTATFNISEFYTSYLPSLTMVVDMDTWKSAFPDSTANAYLINTDGVDLNSLGSDLYKVEGYICTIPFRSNSKNAFRAIMSIVVACAGTFAIMAVLLLIMLLFNLLDMYISEKKRELIILKINGYSGKKVKQYIWKDTMILTVIGILIGVVLGTVMGNITQNALEGDDMLLYHGISWIACAIAAAIIGLLSLVIMLVELRKVSRFHLSDINN